MKDTEDVDLLVDGLEVDDSVVPPKQDARIPSRLRPIGLAQSWKVLQDLSPGVDRLDDFERGCRLILGDVVVDIEKLLAATRKRGFLTASREGALDRV